MSKGQVSVEYLMIIGFVTVISVPFLLIYYDYISKSQDEINTQQINNIANKVVDVAESVYFLGEPSQTTIRVFVPSNVKDASILNEKEVQYRVSTTAGLTEIVQVSSVNLTGSLPITEGIHVITVKAEGSKVSISYD